MHITRTDLEKRLGTAKFAEIYSDGKGGLRCENILLDMADANVELRSLSQLTHVVPVNPLGDSLPVLKRWELAIAEAKALSRLGEIPAETNARLAKANAEIAEYAAKVEKAKNGGI